MMTNTIMTNIDFSSLNYQEAVTAAIAAASAYPDNIILVGGIFLSVATIRYAYVRFIGDKISNLEQNISALSEQETKNLTESIEEHTHILEEGDSRLVEVCWDWIVNNDYIPSPEEIVNILMLLNV